ncbi:hypothetical protein K503DRAFT_869167 [Rhizopogon vinicolor AM-OR11-026]|uniref:Uncharacterized protein n=1 Tax=Rhizopogon vinicolor AM-OR11-026 TaxID=1314800 RepID=A0A1B7MN77_9AGAM|nr:hypothetical protein K503DRAFT_869167 [Rhizopogon vinicolor AM-OR11-026]
MLFFPVYGIEPLVVLGVSSALAAPTFTGIPVTKQIIVERRCVHRHGATGKPNFLVMSIRERCSSSWVSQGYSKL